MEYFRTIQAELSLERPRQTHPRTSGIWTLPTSTAWTWAFRQDLVLAWLPGRAHCNWRSVTGHGLTHFFKGNDDNYRTNDDHPNYWNRAAAFTLGYAIPLKGK
jgi:hypothetical protein